MTNTTLLVMFLAISMLSHLALLLSLISARRRWRWASARVHDLEKTARALLALKDGPRDERYEMLRPFAWDALREALAPLDEAPDGGEEV